MTKVNHYLDLVLDDGQAMRINIQSAKVIVDNINDIKRFIEKYEHEKDLNTLLEVH